VSQENVEIARRAMAEFNERGLPGLLEFADPEIEWTTTGRYVEAGTYRGYDASGSTSARSCGVRRRAHRRR
jgi:ketosteroid isomerase-like protein